MKTRKMLQQNIGAPMGSPRPWNLFGKTLYAAGSGADRLWLHFLFVFDIIYLPFGWICFFPEMWEPKNHPKFRAINEKPIVLGYP